MLRDSKEKLTRKNLCHPDRILCSGIYFEFSCQSSIKWKLWAGTQRHSTSLSGIRSKCCIRINQTLYLPGLESFPVLGHTLPLVLFWDNSSNQFSGDSVSYVTPRCFIMFHHYLHIALLFLPQPGSRSLPSLLRASCTAFSSAYCPALIAGISQIRTGQHYWFTRLLSSLCINVCVCVCVFWLI